MVLDVYARAEQYRESLLDLDARAARQMQEAYRAAYIHAQERLKHFTDEINNWPYTWPEVPERFLFQQEKWKQFYSATRDEIVEYGKIAKGITTNAQGEAIDLGTGHMDGMIRAAFGKSTRGTGTGFTFAKPNDAALRAMVGFTQAGSPLSDLFSRLAPESLDMVTNKMRTAIAIGQNPATLANSMAGPLGIPLWRSMTIARTETLRSYREAQRQTVIANADYLEGWVWHSARDARTCEVCWAMTGKVFPIVDGAPGPEPIPVESGPAPSVPSVGEALQRWVTPGQDYDIRLAASDVISGKPLTTGAHRDAAALLAELQSAPPVAKPIFRGEQLANVPETGSVIRRPLSSWGNEASAEGYAYDPAGAAVYGKGQTGHKVVFEMAGAKAVAAPDLEEYLSGGIMTVASRKFDKAAGLWRVVLQQNRVY